MRRAIFLIVFTGLIVTSILVYPEKDEKRREIAQISSTALALKLASETAGQSGSANLPNDKAGSKEQGDNPFAEKGVCSEFKKIFDSAKGLDEKAVKEFMEAGRNSAYILTEAAVAKAQCESVSKKTTEPCSALESVYGKSAAQTCAMYARMMLALLINAAEKKSAAEITASFDAQTPGKITEQEKKIISALLSGSESECVKGSPISAGSVVLSVCRALAKSDANVCSERIGLDAERCRQIYSAVMRLKTGAKKNAPSKVFFDDLDYIYFAASPDCNVYLESEADKRCEIFKLNSPKK